MSAFHLHMTCDNDAFSEDWPSEVGRILRKLADKLESSGTVIEGGKLMDVNGNSVGSWEYETD